MFYQSFTNQLYDQLLSDRQNLRVENVKVSASQPVKRGSLLAEVDGVFSPVGSTVSSSAALVIAADDFDSGSTVASVFTSGNFHTDKIISAADLSTLKEQLRRDNIFLSDPID